MKITKERHIEIMSEFLENWEKSRDQTYNPEIKCEWGKAIEKLSEAIEIRRRLP